MTDTFKPHTFVLKEDGKFYCKLDGSWIEVSDQEAMKERIKFLPPISVLPVNVPINLNCRVEVIEEWIPGQGYNSPSKEIARVTFEQPEKKDHCWCAETCCASLPNCRLVEQPEAAGQEQSLIDEAGSVASRMFEEINPNADAREQAMFIAGFQEGIKWITRKHSKP